MTANYKHDYRGDSSAAAEWIVQAAKPEADPKLVLARMDEEELCQLAAHLMALEVQIKHIGSAIYEALTERGCSL
jgi:hypothetical protein